MSHMILTSAKTYPRPQTGHRGKKTYWQAAYLPSQVPMSGGAPAAILTVDEGRSATKMGPVPAIQMGNKPAALSILCL